MLRVMLKKRKRPCCRQPWLCGPPCYCRCFGRRPRTPLIQSGRQVSTLSCTSQHAWPKTRDDARTHGGIFSRSSGFRPRRRRTRRLRGILVRASVAAASARDLAARLDHLQIPAFAPACMQHMHE